MSYHTVSHPRIIAVNRGKSCHTEPGPIYAPPATSDEVLVAIRQHVLYPLTDRSAPGRRQDLGLGLLL